MPGTSSLTSVPASHTRSPVISCSVASVLYREGKEDRSWKKEEALREGKTL
ncbi:hypothetical protein [Okeania sp. SIO1I7]|uniref:hypothetical protein n=1 Tax=Okeania sp. SIO1I7 TaxID=2607772 RepID=UPI0025CBB2CF|nr:hypothetical protein [Okeania sp. SIO1I7]